jgi:acyl-CoA hydrolase
MKGKKVSDSRSQRVQVVFPNDVNNNGVLYGGRLLDWIDELGGIVAQRHCRKNVMSASIESLDFLNPIYERDLVILEGWITYTGRTSMEVEIQVISENPLTGTKTKTCQAFLTYVAVNENGHPAKVHPLLVESEIEKERYQMAKERRKVRRNRLTSSK